MELGKINDWLKTNKLSLNVKKSKYMIFHTPQRKVDSLNIQIDNTVIERVRVFDFLGLTINENLTWKDHIDKIANKISRSLGILNKLKHFLPVKVKLLIYSSLISSHLNFGILAWGYKCERIVKLQKKAIRTINLSKYNAHTEPLFKSHKILKIEDILKLQELKFYYKIKHNKLPSYLQQLPLKPNSDFHSYATRSRNKIHLPRADHKYADYCIRYNLPKFINSMPNNIIDKVHTHSLAGFSKYAKNHFIQSYQELCTVPNCFICMRNN